MQDGNLWDKETGDYMLQGEVRGGGSRSIVRNQQFRPWKPSIIVLRAERKTTATQFFRATADNHEGRHPWCTSVWNEEPTEGVHRQTGKGKRKYRAPRVGRKTVMKKSPFRESTGNTEGW